MKKYIPNSPQAVARTIAMFMLADGDIDPSEIEALEWLSLYEGVGIERKEFINVLKEYFDDLADEIEANGTVNLLNPVRVDNVLNDVTDHKKRLATLAISLNMCKGDHALNEPEMALLQHAMNHWQISLDHLKESIETLSFK